MNELVDEPKPQEEESVAPLHWNMRYIVIVPVLS